MNMTSDFKKVFEADPHLASVSIRWERGLENIAQTMIRCDECGGHGYVPQVTSHEVTDINTHAHAQRGCAHAFRAASAPRQARHKHPRLPLMLAPGCNDPEADFVFFATHIQLWILRL